MNSFTLVGIGNLARNPEFVAKGDIAFIRFCLIGTDHAEPDEEVQHARDVITSAWFIAFDKIADDIATNARKGDQLIVTARVRPWYWSDKQGDRHCENEFIVTGFRYGAKRGGPGAVGAAIPRGTPSSPTPPVEEAVTMTG